VAAFKKRRRRRLFFVWCLPHHNSITRTFDGFSFIKALPMSACHTGKNRQNRPGTFLLSGFEFRNRDASGQHHASAVNAYTHSVVWRLNACSHWWMRFVSSIAFISIDGKIGTRRSRLFHRLTLNSRDERPWHWSWRHFRTLYIGNLRTMTIIGLSTMSKHKRQGRAV